MKNEMGVGIMRGPSQNAKLHKVACPFCDFKLELVRDTQSSQLSIAVGLGNSASQWALENAYSDGRFATEDWQAALDHHVKTHSVSDLIAKVYELEGRTATYQATANLLNDFLDSMTEYIAIAYPAVMTGWARKNPKEFIPEQVKPLIESLIERETERITSSDGAPF